MMGFCGESGAFEFSNACIRGSWSALLPAAFVFTLCLFSLPFPGPKPKIFSIIKAPFETYLPLHEAEALDVIAAAGDKVTGDEDVSAAGVEVPDLVPLWRTLVFGFLGLSETLCWLGDASFRFINDPTDVWGGLRPILVAISWLYATIRPLIWPSASPPYDLFSIYVVHLIGGILQFGGILFDHNVVGVPLPPTVVVMGLVANLVVIVVLLAAVVTMPLAIPSKRVKKEDIVSLFLFGGSLMIKFHIGSIRFSGRLYNTVGMDNLQLGLSPRPTCESFSFGKLP